MDRGGAVLFNMAMRTISISILPDSISDLAHKVGVKEIEKKKADPLFQYFVLLSAMSAILSNSIALHMLDGVEK
jgi:hypothetical protein